LSIGFSEVAVLGQVRKVSSVDYRFNEEIGRWVRRRVERLGEMKSGKVR